MTRRRRTKPHVRRGSVSISAAAYEQLKAAVGERERGGRGRISRTVDQLINQYIDQQERHS